jgi:hypothetical protein
MQAGLQMGIEQQDWRNAAFGAGNLCELELALGHVMEATSHACQAVDLAERSGDPFARSSLRTTLAEAFLQEGRLAEGLAVIMRAEALQAERQPEYPLLSSIQGFRYCDIALAQVEPAAWRALGLDDKDSRPVDLLAGLDEIERRAAKTLDWVRAQGFLLDIALDHLTLGRAALYRAILSGVPTDALAAAKIEVGAAVDGLRRSGVQDHLPRGLMTRALLHHVLGDASAARADLDEALEISERGPMRLHLADVHLNRARLFRDRNALAEARALVKECGYHRRDEELGDVERSAGSWG